MFTPKTAKIQELASKYTNRISELEQIFSKPTNIYIDYANVRPWATKLGWHVELNRLKQFLESFNTISTVKIYSGTLIGNKESEGQSKEMKKLGYVTITKPVKIMKK